MPNGPQPFALVITGASGVTSKGIISLNKSKYGASGTVEIKVADLDLNQDSAAIEEVYVKIKSTTEQNGEQVRLVETGADTSIFTGTINLRLGAPVRTTASLKSWAEIRSRPNTKTPTTAPDSRARDGNSHHRYHSPGDLRSCRRVPHDRASTITWTTDEKADSTVNYGETTAMGAYRSDYVPATQHSVNLFGPERGKTYYYEIYSTDEAGNLGRDNNGGSLYTFTTINVPPDLTVYSSNGSETYYDTTVIYGTATDHSGVASVTVNGQPATYRSSDGYYELSVSPDPRDQFLYRNGHGHAGQRENADHLCQPAPAARSGHDPLRRPQRALPGQQHQHNQYGMQQRDRGFQGLLRGALSFDGCLITTADRLLGTRYVASLASGACSTAATAVTIPSNLAVGTYYAGGIADYSGVQYESDETNNTLAGNQLTLGGADLCLGPVHGPASPVTGQTANRDCDHQEYWPVQCRAFYNYYYLSTDNVITTADTYCGKFLCASLAAGAETTVTMTFATPVINSGSLLFRRQMRTQTITFQKPTKPITQGHAGPVAITRLYADLIMTSVTQRPQRRTRAIP